MKYSRKQIRQVLAASLVLTVVVGCDGSSDPSESKAGPPVYEVEVLRKDIYGFWILTPSSRAALKELIDEIPKPKIGSGTLTMSSDEVGMRTCIIAFSYASDRDPGISADEEQPRDRKTGLIEKYPLGYGPHTDTLLSFSWELNRPGEPPSTMFSPKNRPIAKAKQWLDIRYSAVPGMDAYERYYILKRQGHFRLQTHFQFSGDGDSIVLEWMKLDEPLPYQKSEATFIY